MSVFTKKRFVPAALAILLVSMKKSLDESEMILEFPGIGERVLSRREAGLGAGV